MIVHLRFSTGDHHGGRGHFHHGFGDESDRPVPVECHDLFDAVPVGFDQREAAGRGSGVIAHHAEASLRGVAVSFGRYSVLSGVQEPPVITTCS